MWQPITCFSTIKMKKCFCTSTHFFLAELTGKVITRCENYTVVDSSFQFVQNHLNSEKIKFVDLIPPPPPPMQYIFPLWHRMLLRFLLDCVVLCMSSVKHTGPHLQNERTTENWAYGHSHAKFGIYQFGRERRLRSNLMSSLSSCKQGAA